MVGALLFKFAFLFWLVGYAINFYWNLLLRMNLDIGSAFYISVVKFKFHSC
jgi:hypothetical protein